MNIRTMQESNILKTKQHFEILDGLRGVAALAVVVFHFMEIVYSDYSKNFIAHGFLAVDFFFCLSGFVIAYAYDDRIGKMKLGQFFRLRIIRLHPLVILGSVLGLLGFFLDPFDSHTQVYEAGKLFLIFLSSVLLIPYPVMPDRYFNLFGLNAPAWSLFWEYVANILYAFVLYKISPRYLRLLTALFAVLICIACYRSGSLMGGWGKDNFWDGSVRLSFSFLAGMLVYRSNWIIKTKIGFLGLSVLLILTFVFPYSTWNWLTEPIVVIFYFPFIIALGAGATLSDRLRKLCQFSGKISYPLYMTHYVGMWIFGHYCSSHKPVGTQLFFIITAGLIILVGMAYLMMIIYDIPVRKYLTEKGRKA